MTAGNYSDQVETVVANIVRQYDPEGFSDSWELCQKVLDGSAVRRFYVTAELGYANIAIMTDKLLLDIEGDDEDRTTSPGLTVRRLNAISGIDIFEGPVQNVPDTEDAQLVVLAYVAGSEVVDMHWIAYTDEEKDYLLNFGQSLIRAIAKA